jgi:hypothetical protein
VFRTRNAGSSWEPLARGLPQKGAYETVLRDGMSVDAYDPLGIYFGTRSGQVFGSNDEGKTWKQIVGGLPSVVCVKAACVGEPRRVRARSPVSRPKRRRSKPASPRSRGRTRKGR